MSALQNIWEQTYQLNSDGCSCQGAEECVSTCSSWQKGIKSDKEERQKKKKKKKKKRQLAVLLHISAAGRLVGAIAYNYRRCSLPTLSELNKFRVDSLFSHQYFTALQTLRCTQKWAKVKYGIPTFILGSCGDR